MKDCYFEKISKFADDEELKLPERKTAQSAGYDFMVAEDVFIPSYFTHVEQMINSYEDKEGGCVITPGLYLDKMAQLTKFSGAKPTLVPTGIKCKLDPNTYLELSVRSSCPLKYWLVLANGVGIIDADYYNNPGNEGHIYFQIINFSPFDIALKKGDIIGQGIIKPYLTTENDAADGERFGGFGSTS